MKNIIFFGVLLMSSPLAADAVKTAQMPKHAPLAAFSAAATKLVIGGIYEHYSGKRYQVLAVARHSESLEEVVVYKQLYGAGDIWVRPLAMFEEIVTINGVVQPRFRLES